MKFQVMLTNFTSAWNDVVKFIEARPALPVMNNVEVSAHDNSITLRAFNLSEGVSVSRIINADVMAEGAITLPAKTVSEYLRTLSGADTLIVSVDMNTHIATVKCGKNKSTIKGIDNKEFPVDKNAEYDDVSLSIDLPVNKLRRAVELGGFCYATDNHRPALTGIFIETIERTGIRIVSADGYALALAEVEAVINTDIDTTVSMLLPATSLIRALGILSGDVSIDYIDDESTVRMMTSDTVVLFTILDHKFPPFQNVIPKSASSFSDNYLNFNADEFYSGAKLTEIFSRDSANQAKLSYDGEQVLLRGKSQERGDAETTISIQSVVCDDDGYEVLFNIKYLTEYLTVVKRDNDTVDMLCTSPIVFRGGAPEYNGRFVLMPMSK